MNRQSNSSHDHVVDVLPTIVDEYHIVGLDAMARGEVRQYPTLAYTMFYQRNNAPGRGIPEGDVVGGKNERRVERTELQDIKDL